ncbi:hypothetical protein DMENIID0001_132940 [Sergentomyia squamirostris]
MKYLVLLGSLYMLHTHPRTIPQAFNNNLITPNVIRSAPVLKAQIKYISGASVHFGNVLQPIDVRLPPAITWPNKGPTSYYTLVMTDPDAGEVSEVKHWIVGNIPGNSVWRGETIAEYVGSAPPFGTGRHRYIFLVFEQHFGRIQFLEPYSAVLDFSFRPYFSVQQFANKYQLGSPIAGNFFYASWDYSVPILRAQLGLL